MELPCLVRVLVLLPLCATSAAALSPGVAVSGLAPAPCGSGAASGNAWTLAEDQAQCVLAVAAVDPAVPSQDVVDRVTRRKAPSEPGDHVDEARPFRPESESQVDAPVAIPAQASSAAPRASSDLVLVAHGPERNPLAETDWREEPRTGVVLVERPEAKTLAEPPRAVAGARADDASWAQGGVRALEGMVAAAASSPRPCASRDAGVVCVLAGMHFLGAWALYQRFSRSSTMLHQRRAAIHRALASWPEGATAGQLAKALGMQRKTVEYHLQYCVRMGLALSAVDEDGVRRFSLKALPSRPSLADRILRLVAERPGLSVTEMAAALGAPRDTVDRRVKELSIEGRVECRQDGGGRRVHPIGA